MSGIKMTAERGNLIDLAQTEQSSVCGISCLVSAIRDLNLKSDTTHYRHDHLATT